MNIFGDARSSRLGTRSRALCAQVYAVQAPPRRGSNPPSGTLPLVTPNAVILEERTSTGSRSSSTVVTPSSTTTNAANIPSLRPPNGRGPSTSTSASTTAASSALSVVSRFSGPSPSNRAFMDADVGRERPEEVDYKWAQDSYSSLQRTVDTWTFFTVFRSQLYLLDKKWSYIGGFSEDKKKDRTRSLARYLLESVLNLGPTFIKVGQLSSTRSDLFPPEFIQELSKLQDRVPAFSAEKAMAIIEKDLGQQVGKLFQSFDKRPIAAASLGQVHRATLWSGEEVVVKVQRPGLKQLFDIDLDNLRILAEQLDKQDEANDFKGIYQECASVLYQEIDYINEGRNSDRFRRNFKDIPWVRVPIVYWEYSSPRVLTLQYLPGVRITDTARLNEAGVELKLVAKRATEAYLLQILKHGFYHADPHPGNVSVDITPGPYQGALLFYDFGMMGDIIPNIREKLLEVFYGIYRKDANQVIRALTDLQVIRASGDQLSLRRSIAFFIDNLARQTERQETIANIGEDLFAIALDQPFRFPANFTFVLRAFSTLEGIGKTLDPDYKFSELAKPYAQELLDLQNTADSRALIINQVQQQASELTSAAAAMPLRIQRIDALLEQLESGDIKLRVRALEVERSMRRSALMQSATMSAVGALGSLNLGAVLAMGHAGGAATPMCMTVSLVCGLLTLQGLQRVKRLDKFEKDIKGGA